MRRWGLALVVVLLASGCDFSHVDPDADVVISGRALSATGQPLSNIEVHLYKEPDVGEILVGSVLAIGSLGAVCLLPEAPAICDDGRTATTSGDGSYQFTIKGSDTQGLIGDASTLDVVFGDPASDHGASTTLRFKAQTTKVRLPAARLWNARLAVTPHAAARPTFGTTWARLPRADGAGPAYTVQLFDRDDGFTMWSQSASSNNASIDARILEDQDANVAVTARAELDDVDAAYLSIRKPVTGIAGAPPSRNAPCSAVTGKKKVKTFAQDPCGLTDGDLIEPAQLSASNDKTVTGAVVDLGRARSISLIVARGTAGTVVVEVSRNSRTYRRVATTDDAPIVLDPPGSTVARYVRVRSTSGLSEASLAELSVW